MVNATEGGYMSDSLPVLPPICLISIQPIEGSEALISAQPCVAKSCAASR